jgi:hypothetical protein
VLLAAEERTRGLVDLAIVDRSDAEQRAQFVNGPSLEHHVLIGVAQLGPAGARGIVGEVDEDAKRIEARKGPP